MLRHGELVQSGILCGHTDIALSECGKQQLNDAVAKLPTISHCYSSPLVRCQAFAEQFCRKNQLSLQVLAQLKEMNFGDWDGQDYESLWQERKLLNEETPTLGAFWQNPWQCSPPNGETMIDFTTRVDAVWQQLLQQITELSQATTKSENILVLSHGGVIRYILAKVLGLPLPGTAHMTQLDVPYGGLIRLQVFIDSTGKAWPKLML